MQYSRFKGTIYVPEGETSDRSSYLTIKADGHIIYTSPEMTKTSSPVKVDVNITGYNDVEIEWSNNSGYKNISGLNAVHEEDTIKMYYWTDIHAAEPHRDPMLWVRSYVIFGIGIIVCSVRLYKIYTTPYEIYDVREIEQ